jgi:hypothetical protein
MNDHVTHVEVRHWQRIAMTEHHPGDTIWSARVFYGVGGSIYHRGESWECVVNKMPEWLFSHGSAAMADSLAKLRITYSVIRVARKCDLV